MLYFVYQKIGYHTSGGVSPGVEDAFLVVSAFQPQGQRAVFRVEVHAFVDDFLNTGGAFVHEYVYSRIVAQSASCRDCVLEMETRRVVFPGYGGNSSLSEIRVALADVRFREQRNFSVFRSLISSV